MALQVDDVQLAGYTNQEAVEILKQTGKVVKLSIVRYLRGLKFEELQEGITQANVATPTSPYPQTPVTPQASNEDILLTADDHLNAPSQVVVSSLFSKGEKFNESTLPHSHIHYILFALYLHLQ